MKKKVKKIFSLLNNGGKFEFSIIDPSPLNKNENKNGYYFTLENADGFIKAYKHIN